MIFDERSSLRLVRLRVKRASTELAEVFAGLLAKMEEEKAKGAASENVTPFSEITDDDIDALFG